MLKNKMKLRLCGRITSIVILMTFLMTFRAHGEQPMTPPPISGGNEMKRYSDSEIDLLIEELSEAAEEAIERAAAGAAKAASLAALEREASAIREAAQQQALALRWQNEAQAAKRNGVKNAIITGVICLVSGLAVGAGGMFIIGGR